MKNILIPTTGTSPSAIGMPTFAVPTAGFGHGGGVCPQTATLERIAKVDVRDRRTVATAALKGIFPGTPVWRPPVC